MERKIILHFVAFVGKLGSEFVPEGPLRVEIEVSVYVDSSVSSVPVVSTDRGFVVPCDHCDDPVEVARNYNGSGMTVTDIFDASFNDGLLRIALTDHARKRFQLQGEYWEIAKLDPIDGFYLYHLPLNVSELPGGTQSGSFFLTGYCPIYENEVVMFMARG